MAIQSLLSLLVVGLMASHANAAEEGDDDEDEDWNVYDDFNMTRPMPHRTSTSGLASQNDAYWDASKACGRYGAGGGVKLVVQ